MMARFILLFQLVPVVVQFSHWPGVRHSQFSLLVAAAQPDEKEDLSDASDDRLSAGVTMCIANISATIDPILAEYISSGHNPFCLNHGTCKETFMDTPEFPCNCPEGLTGPHCEFEDGSLLPECSMECFNGGTCQAGVKLHTQVQDEEASIQSKYDLEYCICPEGFYGHNCEVEGKRCGNAHCFNGGSCVEMTPKKNATTTTTSADGAFATTESIGYCDCTTAGNGKKSFGGRFCQSEATSYCSKFVDHNGQSFCVNGGTCRSDTILGCECEDGFTGPICEFVVEHEAHNTECTLECHNHGVCRKGAKDLTLLKTFGVNRLNGLGETYSENFEHCVCPPGYVGLTCEHKMDVCPGGNQVCMNGAQCIPETSIMGYTLTFGCDCSKARHTEHKFAGASCEYVSNEFCTVDDKKPLKGVGENAFCTNGGKCLDKVEHGEPHPGCHCEDGFGGDNCEIKGGAYPLDDKSRGGGDDHDQNNKGVQELMGLSVALGCSLVIVFAVGIYIHFRQKRRAKANAFMPYWGLTTLNDSAPAPTYDHIAGLGPFMMANNRGTLIGSKSDGGHVDDGGDGSSSFCDASSQCPSNVPSDTPSSIPSMSSMGTAGNFREDPRTGRVSLMKAPAAEMVNVDLTI